MWRARALSVFFLMALCGVFVWTCVSAREMYLNAGIVEGKSGVQAARMADAICSLIKDKDASISSGICDKNNYGDWTCFLDCVPDKMCRSPLLSYCKSTGANDSLCTVYDEYYRGWDSMIMPNVYRYWRGACLKLKKGGKAVATRQLAGMLLRYPTEMATVGATLAGKTRMSDGWSVDIKMWDLVTLPVAGEAEYENNVDWSLPMSTVAYLYDTSVGSKGGDTSRVANIDSARAMLNNWDGKRGGGELHLTMVFSKDGDLDIGGGKKYELKGGAFTGALDAAGGTRGGVREAWATITVTMDEKGAAVSWAREAVAFSDGRLLVRCGRVGNGTIAVSTNSFMSTTSQAPKMWLGIRDFCIGLGYG